MAEAVQTGSETSAARTSEPGAGAEATTKVRGSENPQVIRTDFSDQAAWESIVKAVKAPCDAYYTDVEFLDDPAFREVASTLCSLDESSRALSTRNATGTEASTTGRVEVGTSKALLAQWERKEKLRLLEKPAVVEKPVVVEKPSQPRSYVAEKLFGERSSFHESPTGGVGVKTLGLDMNSFVPKGSNIQSEKTISASKHDTEIIEELLLQHHVMSSFMQSRLTNMQVVRRFWNKNDMKGAIEAMKKMGDQSVLVEVLSVFMEKTDLLTLEICYLLTPLLNGLLSTDNDRFLMTALELLGKLVETFGSIIHATRTSAPSMGVDLQAEQRLERCNLCYHELQAVDRSLLPLMRKGGDVTKAARTLQEALGRV